MNAISRSATVHALPSATAGIDSNPDANDRTVRLRFMRIDADTGVLLREFWRILEPAMPALLEEFYAHVAREPRLAALLGDNVARLKNVQTQHWRRLFAGTFDEEYMRSIRTIGMVHNRIGLEPRWYIGGYNVILGRIVELAARNFRRKTDRLSRLLHAVVAAVMLDMDLAISVYQDAMIEDRMRRQTVVDEAIHQFDRQINGVLDAVGEAAKGMSRSADTLTGAATQASSQSTAVAGASEQASANVQTVASAAEELSASIAEISRQVAESTRITGNAVVQAGRTDATVKSLADRAKSIGDVVRLISDVAGQTNLLALNATIEAARAGEAGKGFAVVAAEVKNLANQTARATEDIGQQIAAIQSVTKDAVAAIQEIAGTISSVSTVTTAIAAAVEEQGAATKEIARNVQQASLGTTEVSSNIVQVNHAVGEISGTAARVQSAASALSHQSSAIRTQVEDFFAKIRAA
jgi:methyl-accepting chemotaxis protein